MTFMVRWCLTFLRAEILEDTRGARHTSDSSEGRVSQGVQGMLFLIEFSDMSTKMPTKIETCVGDWKIWETTLLKKGNCTISKLTTASERMAHESPQKVSQQFIWWLSKHPWRSFCKADQDVINRWHVKRRPNDREISNGKDFMLQSPNWQQPQSEWLTNLRKSISAVYLMVVKASLAQFLQNRPGFNQQITCEKKTQWQRNVKR